MKYSKHSVWRQEKQKGNQKTEGKIEKDTQSPRSVGLSFHSSAIFFEWIFKAHKALERIGGNLDTVQYLGSWVLPNLWVLEKFH